MIRRRKFLIGCKKRGCDYLFKKKSQKREIKTSPVGLWLQGNEDITPPGYISVTKNEEVKKCIHKIADLVSSMTIMLMENGEDGDIRLKNELSKKIDVNPNKFMIRKNFIYKVVSDMIIHGNSVVSPKLSEGLLDNLTIWDMSGISFGQDDDESYYIRKGIKKINPDEVLHFVLIPDDTLHFKGQGFIPIVKETILNILQAQATKTSFLKSKWRPSLIINVDTDVEAMQIKEEREKILNSYVSDTSQGEPWIIPAGEISVSQIKPLSLQDLNIMEGLTLDKRSIASAFGVPPYMVGVGTFNKDEYNNFINSVVMPISKIIEQELSKKLVFNPRWYFKFNSKSLIQYDLGELTSHVKEMVSSGLINRNEGRNNFDYSPVAGLNDYVVLENYIPISEVGNQKKLGGGDENNEQGNSET
jgi:HK97 family phage portal protein